MKTKFEVSNNRESVKTRIVVNIVNICQEQASGNKNIIPIHYLVLAIISYLLWIMRKKLQHLEVRFDKRARSFHLTWLIGLELFWSEILTPYSKVLQMICEDIL